MFLRFHDLLLQKQEEVLDLIQLESGKARRHALDEVLDAAIVAQYYALRAPLFLRPKRATLLELTLRIMKLWYSVRFKLGR